jgi:hypothetical protein
MSKNSGWHKAVRRGTGWRQGVKSRWQPSVTLPKPSLARPGKNKPSPTSDFKIRIGRSFCQPRFLGGLVWLSQPFKRAFPIRKKFAGLVNAHAAGELQNLNTTDNIGRPGTSSAPGHRA